MELCPKLISYLDNCQIYKTLGSNFLLTDLERIIYSNTNDIYNCYCMRQLNIDIISLIDKWKNENTSLDTMLVENNPNISIINNDTCNYSAIMIFPIYADNEIVGLAIYFRTTGNYIKSSTKAPNTVRKWIMKFIEK